MRFAVLVTLFSVVLLSRPTKLQAGKLVANPAGDET
jgi:hypothetical protein